MRNTFLSLFAIVVSLNINAQKATAVVQVLSSGNKTSLRGLSVVTDNIVWVSGSNGTVGRTTNGGKNWTWMTVKGFEKSDFRDIEAFDATTAVIMSVAEPAYILKTNDAGATWKVVYENKTKGMFLDAMEFWNRDAGIVIGDPVGGRFFITRTFDNGNTWQDIPFEKRPLADSGEACFAASGTNVRVLDRDEAVFVSGGLRSELYVRDQRIVLPIIQGKETTGANSIAVWDRYKAHGAKHFVVTGGDFNTDSSSEKNCFYSHDNGKTWHAPQTPPHGYRSCVEYLYSKMELVSCGLTGVDYSGDGGMNWKWVSKESFHVCRRAKAGTAVFFAGNNGKIGKLIWTP